LAQKTFKERRERHLRGLETKVADLEALMIQRDEENAELRRLLSNLLLLGNEKEELNEKIVINHTNEITNSQNGIHINSSNNNSINGSNKNSNNNHLSFHIPIELYASIQTVLNNPPATAKPSESSFLSPTNNSKNVTTATSISSSSTTPTTSTTSTTTSSSASCSFTTIPTISLTQHLSDSNEINSYSTIPTATTTLATTTINPITSSDGHAMNVCSVNISSVDAGLDEQLQDDQQLQFQQLRYDHQRNLSSSLPLTPDSLTPLPIPFDYDSASLFSEDLGDEFTNGSPLIGATSFSDLSSTTTTGDLYSDHSRMTSMDMLPAATEGLSPNYLCHYDDSESKSENERRPSKGPSVLNFPPPPPPFVPDFSYRDPNTTMSEEEIKKAWIIHHPGIMESFTPYESFEEADWSHPADLHYGYFMDLDFNSFDISLLNNVDIEQIACVVLRNKLNAILEKTLQHQSQDVEQLCGLLNSQATCQERLNTLNTFMGEIVI